VNNNSVINNGKEKGKKIDTLKKEKHSMNSNSKEIHNNY
jgi:hypothetical protein